MSKLLLRIEATEARIASYSCPRGIAGRVHSLRLRRLFQPYRGLRWSSSSSAQDISSSDFVSVFQTNDQDKYLEHEQSTKNDILLATTNRHPSEPSSGAADALERYDYYTSRAHSSTSVDQTDKILRKLLLQPHLARARYGDIGWKIMSDDLAQSEAAWANASTDAIEELVRTSSGSLHAALRTGNPFNILEATVELVRLSERSLSSPLASLPRTTFSEILRCLDPDTLVGRYLNLHKEISATQSTTLDALSEDARNGYRFCEFLMTKVQTIIELRNDAGLNLSLPDYKYLLRCARTVGNRKVLYKIWEAMQRERIFPDTDCYNHYFAAQVWSDTLLPLERHKVRASPYHLDMRQQDSRPKEFKGHSVGPGGIRASVTKGFNQMARNGVFADEETFCLMIIAFAREGDLDGIKSVLENVWGIDVGKLMKGEDATTVPTKSFSRDSPLRPSEVLMMSLAHAYGVNNAIPTALRLVDYVSRHYGVDITVSVWEELLERTYVLARKRSSRQRERGDGTGQLPSDAVGNLWATLIEQPYNIKPTMHMYDKIIMNLIRRQLACRSFSSASQAFSNAQKLMEEAYNSQKSTRKAWQSTMSTNIYDAPQSRQADRMGREKIFLSLRGHRNSLYYRRWCRQLLQKGSIALGRQPSFSLRTIPSIIEKWTHYVPRVMDYETLTGRVSLKLIDDGAKDEDLTENSQNVDDPKRSSASREEAVFDDDDIL